MKLRFKHQQFQADAARAVCDVFGGQRFATPTYLVDQGRAAGPQREARLNYSGWNNADIQLSLAEVLKNLADVQRANRLPVDRDLDGWYNLTVEMETGTGKTYTYIKTMLELNQRYGWSKFIVVVPSVAIREGVFKTFEITQEHFNTEYGRKIRFFIYNSGASGLAEIERFATDASVSVMIINSQAFNAKGRDARRIYMHLDEFGSRRPIDLLARAKPILIIDEPQSVEGEQTKKALQYFNPLFTLRYSATHRRDYNKVYRLDALDAYNQRLVKKIRVTGIAQSGASATGGYVYVERVNLFPDRPPSATIEFDCKTKTGVRKKRVTVSESDRYDLHEQSGGLDEYQDRYVISRVDGRDNSVEFLNGKKMFAGQMAGAADEGQLRRLQIRETIAAHLETERRLFARGVKVLSLFFIDEVAKYRQYAADGQPANGEYAAIFEEEYAAQTEAWQTEFGQGEYEKYLSGIAAAQTHTGYFSIDKKNQRLVDSRLGDRRERTSDDSDAYDLIMRNKELLLSRENPVRFIFSHSALREGWDNPNVFQICTLKTSGSEVRKRQEVGRGLRLCVNQAGERMDANTLGADVHAVNTLTVVASESYERFAAALQQEIAEALADRPLRVTAALFEGRELADKAAGTKRVIDSGLAREIYEELIASGYVKRGELTEKYRADLAAGTLTVSVPGAAGCAESVAEILAGVLDPLTLRPENGREGVTVRLNRRNADSAEFKKLWQSINKKTAYAVDFSSEELIEKAVAKLDRELEVTKIVFQVQTGELEQIPDKESLLSGSVMPLKVSETYRVNVSAGAAVKYDLIGRIVEETFLTRKTVARILMGIAPHKFDLFKENPEDFIIKASHLINEAKATVVVGHITYRLIDGEHGKHKLEEIFTEPELKGTRDNTMAAQRHLYDHILFDSESKIEREFARRLEAAVEIAVYVKLPRGFYISTPVGKYNPDWAIAFREGKVKHIYFVAETKGSMSTLNLREIENAKIQCARKHFETLSGANVRYDVVSDFDALLQKVMK